MPIRVGSRLAQLIALHRAVGIEIEAERKVEALKDPGRPPMVKTPRKPQATSEGQARLIELGVTSAEVKAWALEVGLISEVARGRCAASLIDEYDMAHKLARKAGA